MKKKKIVLLGHFNVSRWRESKNARATVVSHPTGDFRNTKQKFEISLCLSCVRALSLVRCIAGRQLGRPSLSKSSKLSAQETQTDMLQEPLRKEPFR